MNHAQFFILILTVVVMGAHRDGDGLSEDIGITVAGLAIAGFFTVGVESQLLETQTWWPVAPMTTAAQKTTASAFLPKMLVDRSLGNAVSGCELRD